MKQPEPQQEYLAKAKTKEQQLDTTNSQWHEVASGESLSVIAQRYGVTAIQIKTWNNLEKNTIQRGQKLRVKEKPAEQPILIATIVTDSVDPNRLAPIKQNPAKPIIPSFDYHKVQRGENLSAIAKRYHGVTAGDIKELNQLPNNNLRVGQVLKIPRG